MDDGFLSDVLLYQIHKLNLKQERTEISPKKHVIYSPQYTLKCYLLSL